MHWEYTLHLSHEDLKVGAKPPIKLDDFVSGTVKNFQLAHNVVYTNKKGRTSYLKRKDGPVEPVNEE